MEATWRFALIALIAVAAGAGVGILLGGANPDPFETVIKTVAGERQTVTETETETVTEAKTETVTDSEAVPDTAGGDEGGDDDADGDGCSDSYDGACLNPFEGNDDVDCTEIGEQDFNSIGDDPYGLDPNLDGAACESH